jgi:hypothetical protein
MKKVLFMLLLIFVFCASGFSQKGERIMCPNVDVADAPQGTRVGELVTFRADVDTDVDEKAMSCRYGSLSRVPLIRNLR